MVMGYSVPSSKLTAASKPSAVAAYSRIRIRAIVRSPSRQKARKLLLLSRHDEQALAIGLLDLHNLSACVRAFFSQQLLDLLRENVGEDAGSYRADHGD